MIKLKKYIWKYIVEQWIVTILDTCNEFTRFCDTKRKREEGTSMTKESRGIDNVSLKCFIVGRCRSGRSSNRFPFFSSSPLLPFLKATLRRGKLSTFISANDKSMRRLRRQNGSIYFEYIQIFDSTFPLEIYDSLRKKKKKEKWTHKNSLERDKQWTKNILSRQDKTTFFCQESCSSSTSQEQRPVAKSSSWRVSPDSRIETIFKLKSISVVSPRTLFNAKNYRVADYSYGMRAD